MEKRKPFEKRIEKEKRKLCGHSKSDSPRVPLRARLTPWSPAPLKTRPEPHFRRPTMSAVFLDEPFTVNSPNTAVTDEEILSTYVYNTVQVDGSTVTPMQDTYQFKTSKKVPKTGMLLVGWGGNNGSTVRTFRFPRGEPVALKMCATRAPRCILSCAAPLSRSIARSAQQESWPTERR